MSICAVLLAASPCLRAQETVTFDPAVTTVQSTLGCTLRTVRRTFQLKHGEMQFDPSTGQATGTIAVDATSGDSGNSSRDRNLRERAGSAKYPEIVFAPSPVTAQSAGTLEIPASAARRCS